VKRVSKKVREEAALICQMAASNRYDVCGAGPEQFAQSAGGLGLRLAAAVIKEVPKRCGLWWINGQWAEAEALLRTGWTP
jgi:hypothetical protein